MKTDYDKGLYKASMSEIFWKNFFVGFSRALGGLVVNIGFLILFYIMFVNVVLPYLTPLFETFRETQETMQQFRSPSTFFGLPSGGSTLDSDAPEQTN